MQNRTIKERKTRTDRMGLVNQLLEDIGDIEHHFFEGEHFAFKEDKRGHHYVRFRSQNGWVDLSQQHWGKNWAYSDQQRTFIYNLYRFVVSGRKLTEIKFGYSAEGTKIIKSRAVELGIVNIPS